jgi:hypothetical protein
MGLAVICVCVSSGFQPLAVYARRALLPLVSKLDSSGGPIDSWAMLGTNLSVLNPSTGEWSTDTSRLLLMDMKDFNKLGIAIDELIDAYIQTCLATLAIDRMACRLTNKNGVFDKELYASVNQDDGLLREIMPDSSEAAAAATTATSASLASSAAAAAATSPTSAAAAATVPASTAVPSHIRPLSIGMDAAAAATAAALALAAAGRASSSGSSSSSSSSAGQNGLRDDGGKAVDLLHMSPIIINRMPEGGARSIADVALPSPLK